MRSLTLAWGSPSPWRHHNGVANLSVVSPLPSRSWFAGLCFRMPGSRQTVTQILCGWGHRDGQHARPRGDSVRGTWVPSVPRSPATFLSFACWEAAHLWPSVILGCRTDPLFPQWITTKEKQPVRITSWLVKCLLGYIKSQGLSDLVEESYLAIIMETNKERETPSLHLGNMKDMIVLSMFYLWNQTLSTPSFSL